MSMKKNQQFEKNLSLVADLIRRSPRIILACHMNPDGDAIGSLLALGLGLRKMRKSVVLLCPDPVPERYRTLPGATSVKQEYKGKADLAISVDCGSLQQLARLEMAFGQSKRIIEIDHHEYRTRFGDLQLISDQVSCVGEIVLQLLQSLKIKLDDRIGECLMISTLVETSSFSRQEVGPTTFDFCSRLMKLGIDFQKISERYYWRKRFSAVKLAGLCFTRVTLRAHRQLVWSIARARDYRECQARQEDIDHVADEMMMIEGVKVALLFREIDGNMLRVSLRSKDRINIGSLATLYGGGGHRDVAGCRIHNNDKTLEQFIEQASQLIYRNQKYKD